MSPIVIWALVFVVSIAVLVKASDVFIEYSEKIGVAFGVPAYIMGISLVAFGTSLPELVSSLVAVFKGETSIVASNVIGSNIANVYLVMGVVGLVGSKLAMNFKMSKVDIVMFLGSALAMFLASWDMVFTRMEAVVFCIALIANLYFIFKADREESEVDEEDKLQWYVIPMLILCSIGIYFGASYNVESIIQLSTLLGIGTEVIAVTAVALGTSLPELVVSITAVRRGNIDMAIGNIQGSNIFNILAVMGIPGLITNLELTPILTQFSLPLMMLATFLYLAFVLPGKGLKKWMGALLLGIYIFFVVRLYL